MGAWPANMADPMTCEENARWNCDAKSAPLDRPEIVTRARATAASAKAKEKDRESMCVKICFWILLQNFKKKNLGTQAIHPDPPIVTNTRSSMQFTPLHSPISKIKRTEKKKKKKEKKKKKALAFPQNDRGAR
jgi:hypothetical protein